MTDPIRIEGLSEVRRAMKTLNKDAPKALRLALNDAAEVIVDYAKPRVPARSGKARASVKARSTQTMARVQGGGNRAPHYPWLDFGGRVGPKKSVKRPFYKKGRYIYRGYDANKDQFREKAADRLVDVARAAGLEVEAG